MLTTTAFISNLCVHSFQHNKWQNNYTSVLKKTTYYIKSPFSSARKQKLVKTTQFNQVTLECHGTAVLDKNSALTSGKVYRNSSLSTMLALAWWNFIDIRNGKKYCELHKKYVNRVKNENYSPTLKSWHKMALHRNVSSTKIHNNTAWDLLNSHPKWPLKTPRNVS